jgi:hypothetical protein
MMINTAAAACMMHDDQHCSSATGSSCTSVHGLLSGLVLPAYAVYCLYVLPAALVYVNVCWNLEK